MIKHTVKNELDMVEANVSLLNNGKYSVTLKDLDSNEVLPTAIIYKDLESAVKKANEIAS